MNKKTVNVDISISGSTGSGKSTILWMIMKQLIESGVEFDYSFDDSDYKDIDHLRHAMEHDFKSITERLMALRDKIKVNLNEMQVIPLKEPII